MKYEIASFTGEGDTPDIATQQAQEAMNLWMSEHLDCLVDSLRMRTFRRGNQFEVKLLAYYRREPVLAS